MKELKIGESAIINGNIKVTVLREEDGELVLAIDAPDGVSVIPAQVVRLEKWLKTVTSEEEGTLN